MIAAPERSPQGQQETSTGDITRTPHLEGHRRWWCPAGILPVRLTSRGTDAGGVQRGYYPYASPRGAQTLVVSSGDITRMPHLVGHRRWWCPAGILPVRLTSRGTAAGGVQRGYYPYASPRGAQPLVVSSGDVTRMPHLEGHRRWWCPAGILPVRLTSRGTDAGGVQRGCYPYASPRGVQMLVVSSGDVTRTPHLEGHRRWWCPAGILPVRLTSRGTDAGGVQRGCYPYASPRGAQTLVVSSGDITRTPHLEGHRRWWCPAGILPVRLTSRGTDAGGVQRGCYPYASPRGVQMLVVSSGDITRTPHLEGHRRWWCPAGMLPVRLTSRGTDAGGVQPTPLITRGRVKVVSCLLGDSNEDTNCWFYRSTC